MEIVELFWDPGQIGEVQHFSDGWGICCPGPGQDAVWTVVRLAGWDDETGGARAGGYYWTYGEFSSWCDAMDRLDVMRYGRPMFLTMERTCSLLFCDRAGVVKFVESGDLRQYRDRDEHRFAVREVLALRSRLRRAW